MIKNFFIKIAKKFILYNNDFIFFAEVFTLRIKDFFRPQLSQRILSGVLCGGYFFSTFFICKNSFNIFLNLIFLIIVIEWRTLLSKTKFISLLEFFKIFSEKEKKESLRNKFFIFKKIFIFFFIFFYLMFLQIIFGFLFFYNFYSALFFIIINHLFLKNHFEKINKIICILLFSFSVLVFAIHFQSGSLYEEPFFFLNEDFFSKILILNEKMELKNFLNSFQFFFKMLFSFSLTKFLSISSYFIFWFFSIFHALNYVMETFNNKEKKIEILKKNLLFFCGFFLIVLPLKIILNLNNHASLIFLPSFILIIPWVSDIGAFLFGKLIRGKKLAPKISPNKTWSGFIGGVFFSVLFSQIIFNNKIFNGGLEKKLLFFATVTISIVGQIGDLIESFIKRKFNVKDVGNIMPGHGGLLDRFDGVIFSAIFINIFGLLSLYSRNLNFVFCKKMFSIVSPLTDFLSSINYIKFLFL